MIRRKLSKDNISRFWAKVSKIEDKCWLWTAAKTEKGYGVFGIGKETDKAHRISWRILHGPIPNKLFVLHKCDIPACVNPDHLFLGTNKDNVDDMVNKKRNSKPPLMAGWNKKYIADEFICMLGKAADTEIAKLANTNKYVIQRIRRERGIGALPSQTRFKSGDFHPRWSRREGSNLCLQRISEQ